MVHKRGGAHKCDESTVRRWTCLLVQECEQQDGERASLFRNVRCMICKCVSCTYGGQARGNPNSTNTSSHSILLQDLIQSVGLGDQQSSNRMPSFHLQDYLHSVGLGGYHVLPISGVPLLAGEGAVEVRDRTRCTKSNLDWIGKKYGKVGAVVGERQTFLCAVEFSFRKYVLLKQLTSLSVLYPLLWLHITAPRKSSCASVSVLVLLLDHLLLSLIQYHLYNITPSLWPRAWYILPCSARSILA